MNTIIGSRQPTSMMDYMQNNPYTRSLELRDSSMFRQTSPEGRSRMMQNVSRGLPANVDPQRVFVSGYRGLVPQYSAALGASGGFGGGWGQVGQPQTGSTKAERDAAAMVGRSGGTVAGGPQPEAITSTQEPIGGGKSQLGVTSFDRGLTDFSGKTDLTLGGSSMPSFGGYTSPLANATPPPFPEQYENIEMFTPYGTASTRRQRR